jgi:hypothetical protein
MIMWENEREHLTRLMVRARVYDLQDVPQFLVLTEAEGFQGESWSVQVEIVEQEMLGALPADEELVLEPNVQGNLVPFDFFNLGQQGPPPQQNQNQNLDLNAFGEDGAQGGQNQIEFDLNIEAVVEGDEAEFNDFLDFMMDVQHSEMMQVDNLLQHSEMMQVDTLLQDSEVMQADNS